AVSGKRCIKVKISTRESIFLRQSITGSGSSKNKNFSASKRAMRRNFPWTLIFVSQILIRFNFHLCCGARNVEMFVICAFWSSDFSGPTVGVWRRGKGFEPSSGVTHCDQQADRCLNQRRPLPRSVYPELDIR